MGRVSANVSAELTGQIGDGRKDAARNDFAFNAGKPDFDLVEPARVCGSEVKGHFGVISEELLDKLRFMGRSIVHNDVDVLLSGATRHHLVQESYELLTGVSGGGLSPHLTCLGVESCVKR